MTRSAAARSASGEASDLDEFRGRLFDGRRGGHDYVALLGLRTYEPLRIYAQARGGLAYGAFERLQRNTALPTRTLAELAGIPLRTLARRKTDGRFDPEESDRLLRIARVVGAALDLFEGDVDEARRWLGAEQVALGGHAPLALLKTDVGAREVEQLVGRLEHGIPA
jgi:putative toxin-antitoxin system antitoxin component (TIGR02293 family)